MVTSATVAEMPRGGNDTVSQHGNRIDTNMGLHAEMPLVALLGLLHLRIVLLGLVLGREEVATMVTVNDGPLTHEQACSSRGARYCRLGRSWR